MIDPRAIEELRSAAERKAAKCSPTSIARDAAESLSRAVGFETADAQAAALAEADGQVKALRDALTKRNLEDGLDRSS